LRQAFQVEISIRNLFMNPTIAKQGEMIEEAFITKIEALSEEEVASLQGKKKTS
jgi:hypothetical protein